MISLANTNLSGVGIETGIAVGAIQDTKHEGSAGTSGGALAPQPIQASAVTVPGPGVDSSDVCDDDFSTTSPSVIQQTVDESHGTVDAELIDPEEENQKMKEKVEWELAEQEMNTPVVEVVSDNRCNPKVQRLVILGLVLAIVAVVLGIVLPWVLESDPMPSSPMAALIPQDLLDLLSNVSFDKGELC